MASPCRHFRLPQGFRVEVDEKCSGIAPVPERSGKKSDAPVGNFTLPVLLNAPERRSAEIYKAAARRVGTPARLKSDRTSAGCGNEVALSTHTSHLGSGQT